MIFIAGAFGTFALFVLLALLALPVTAMLDKSLGKEKALLLWAGVLLLFTFFVFSPEGPGKRSPKAGRETSVVAERLDRAGDPFARADLVVDGGRNAFAPYSDTTDLPPVVLELPPWIPLDFALPPTIPGPAPGHRRVLRGAKPSMTKDDASAIAPIPDAVFADYMPVAKDVYDWIVQSGKPFYFYLLAIQEDGTWYSEGEEAFERLKWVLAEGGEGIEKLTVRGAYIGSEEQATKYLKPLEVLKRRQKGVTEKAASEAEWNLRRSVANLYSEALARQLGRRTIPTNNVDPDRLRAAARDMTEVGKTGKEDKEGWRRAVTLLETALTEVRANRGPAERAELLLELLEAQHALRDEQAVLRTLAEYMETAPDSAEARTWLGNLHLVGMRLPRVARRYFGAALRRDSRHGPALIGEGDALSFLGQHKEALRSYGRATGDAAKLRRATAELRLADLKAARGTTESVLSRAPSHLAAILGRACALYALGDLETARAGFEQVAASPDAQGVRAMACYDLGLTCFRMGQYDAALAAFDACEKALKQGSSTGPTPDETVSPALGRALVAFAVGDEDALAQYLDQARREAPLNSYVETFGGLVASLQSDDASAVRALDRARGLAPAYAELDGWLGKTYLRLALSAALTGADPKEQAETFERSIAFAHRAAEREERAERDAYRMRLREALVRIGAQHLPARQRYELALAAVDKILSNSQLREQPAALALAGYCNFQLGNYDECIRKLQSVLDVVPDTEDATWKGWQDYATTALAAVKHWRALEEKVVNFKSPTLNKDMSVEESNGVRVTVEFEEERLWFHEEASEDGSLDKPTTYASTTELFAKETLESVELKLRIPRRDARGDAVNNITFGVQVLATGRRGGRRGAKVPGIGIFYDKNKIAVRIGGGQDKKYKEGRLVRLDPEQLWPDTEVVDVRIVRTDAAKGTMEVYLNGTLVISDSISGFKLSRGTAALWMGGYANQAEPFDVRVSDIRVVRRKAKKRP